nr:hypothetical protein HmN_000115100 [Hymenolepis microstoma]
MENSLPPSEKRTLKKSVHFNEVVEVFEYEVLKPKVPSCVMLLQAKYSSLVGDNDDRRIHRIAQLTGCTTRLNMSRTQRNKHGEMCFVLTVEGHKKSNLKKFEKLIHNKFPDILFTQDY